MKNGICPKCQGQNVYQCRIPRNGGGLCYGDNCYFMNLNDVHGWHGTLEWETYLCVDCGYFENYCLDKDLMAKITGDPRKSIWKKISF